MDIMIKVGGYQLVTSEVVLFEKKENEVEVELNDPNDKDVLRLRFFFIKNEKDDSVKTEYELSEDNKTLFIKCVNFNRSAGLIEPLEFAELGGKTYFLLFWVKSFASQVRKLELSFFTKA